MMHQKSNILLGAEPKKFNGTERLYDSTNKTPLRVQQSLRSSQ